MMQQFRPGGFRMLPPVVKNLLIINGLLFLPTFFLFYITPGETLYNLVLFQRNYLALYFPASESFKVWQFITYMFMHADLTHIFFNMFALWMFGNVLENYWGPKRFLNYYLITGIGAAAVYLVWTWLNGGPFNVPMMGASGAVFGLLLAFGMMFPNSTIYVFFALPIKAKYFVIIYGALELILGLSNNPNDFVAHFAHLGGMITGFIVFQYWKRKGTLH
jgi:membrane associated rhomboid family serine protease